MKNNRAWQFMASRSLVGRFSSSFSSSPLFAFSTVSAGLLAFSSPFLRLKDEHNSSKVSFPWNSFSSSDQTFESRVKEMKRWWGSLPSGGNRDIQMILFVNFLVLAMWKIPSQSVRTFMTRHFICGLDQVSRGHLHTLLTSAFSHSSFLHFAINGYVFWQFASLTQSLYGRENFLKLFFGGALFSSAFSIVNQVRLPLTSGSVGASGAILAIVIALLSHPAMSEQKLRMMFLPVEFTSTQLVSLAFLIDLVGLCMRWRFMDHAGHLGGSLTGLCMANSNRNRKQPPFSTPKWS